MQIGKAISFRPVHSLSEALIVRNIRNESRQNLTNNTKHIGILQQVYWYFTYYRKAAKNGKYRIFTAQKNDLPIGYGALEFKAGKLYITECVSPKYRMQGYGTAILKKLTMIAKTEKLPLVAEIRATNKNSISLHTKYGFRLDATMMKSGLKLRVYKKAWKSDK